MQRFQQARGAAGAATPAPASASAFGAAPSIQERVVQATGGKAPLAQRVAQATGAAARTTRNAAPKATTTSRIGAVKGAIGATILPAVPSAVMGAAKLAGADIPATAVTSPLEFIGTGLAQAYADYMPEFLGGLPKSVVEAARDANVSAYEGTQFDPAQMPASAATMPPATGGQVIPPVAPSGTNIQVERTPTGLSFTGGDAAPAGVRYTGGAAGALKGGTVNTIPAANFIQPSGEVSAELSAARAAAAERGDFDAVAASFGGAPTRAGAADSAVNRLQKQLDSLPPIQTQGDVARYQAIAGALNAAQATGAEQARFEATSAATQSKNALDAAFKAAGLGIQQQTADAATLSATARAKGQAEVIPGLPGEAPLLVNKTTGRAQRALVIPTFEEFDAKMREETKNTALTAEQMNAAYQELFGQQ